MNDPAVGQVVDGRYQLEELIGKGGMGLVFRARHVFTHQQVALKLITTDGLDPDTMARFLDEARVAATIGHPAIVETSDANRTPEGQLYIVMELLVGRPLRSAMVKGLTADDVKRIALELLDAIEAAHARGVVHRDLKPENIYLVAPTAAVKVLDFGIAKMRGGKTTAQGIVLGTLEYMAPEQLIDSEAVDARADLWAVGVILYELVSGVRPYTGSREELFHSLATREPTPITSVAPIADDLAAFFATALARDPAMRFQTAGQMIAVIRRLTLARVGEAVTTPMFNTAGPTMGTGVAWVQPASGEPRARTMSAPPLATHNAPGLASTAIQSVQSPAPAPAPRSRKPWFVIAAIGVIAAIVIAVLATRSDEIVVVEVPRDHKLRCSAACKKLEGCGLAQTTCEADCDRNFLKADCVEAAADCTAAASCIWEASCGGPPIGDQSCVATLACHQKCGLSNTSCLCGCNQQMGPKASLVMGKLFTCHQNHPTNAQFAQHCMQTAVACQQDEDARTVLDRQIPRPAPGDCEATCARLATCDLAGVNCVAQCEQGGLDLACMNAATTCTDRAMCHWKQLCGRTVKTGAGSCTDAMTCWSKTVGMPIEAQCSACYDQMSASVALDLARYQRCRDGATQRAGSDATFDAIKEVSTHCDPLLMKCYGLKRAP